MAMASVPSGVRLPRSIHAALGLASIAAGVIHAAAAAGHSSEDPLLGAAFVAVALFQVTWAVPATVGPDHGVLPLGAAVNAAIVVGWLVSRTVGLPIGPHAWVPEAPGALDVAATSLELLIVGGSLLGTPDRTEAEADPGTPMSTGCHHVRP
jgi:hypothetical protein